MRGFGKGENNKRMSHVLEGVGRGDNTQALAGTFDDEGMPEYTSPVLDSDYTDWGPGNSPNMGPYSTGLPDTGAYFPDIPTISDAPGTSKYNPIQYSKPPTPGNINPADVGKLITYGGQLFRIAETVANGQRRLVAQPANAPMTPATMGMIALLAFMILK